MILVFDSWRIHHELMVVCRKIQPSPPPCRFPHSSRSSMESDVAKSAHRRRPCRIFSCLYFSCVRKFCGKWIYINFAKDAHQESLNLFRVKSRESWVLFVTCY